LTTTSPIRDRLLTSVDHQQLQKYEIAQSFSRGGFEPIDLSSSLGHGGDTEPPSRGLFPCNYVINPTWGEVGRNQTLELDG